MKALLLFAAFVIATTAAAVLIGSYIERQTSAQMGTVVMLVLFFGGIVVSWIGTVFAMDHSTTFTPSGSRSKPRRKAGNIWRPTREAESCACGAIGIVFSRVAISLCRRGPRPLAYR
jgi:hypothetical protein